MGFTSHTQTHAHTYTRRHMHTCTLSWYYLTFSLCVSVCPCVGSSFVVVIVVVLLLFVFLDPSYSEWIISIKVTQESWPRRLNKLKIIYLCCQCYSEWEKVLHILREPRLTSGGGGGSSSSRQSAGLYSPVIPGGLASDGDCPQPRSRRRDAREEDSPDLFTWVWLDFADHFLLPCVCVCVWILLFVGVSNSFFLVVIFACLLLFSGLIASFHFKNSKSPILTSFILKQTSNSIICQVIVKACKNKDLCQQEKYEATRQATLTSQY